jgi:diadenosine tetraphosphate (Ap4A) HIT family hydrolase
MAEYDKKIGPWTNLVSEWEDYLVYEDAYPVTEGHLLFVPRHDSAHSIARALGAAYRHGNNMRSLGKIEAFNVGINQGEAAGQTVPWPHVHLIPRSSGDMEDPTGGVRHVIPEQGNYRDVKYNKPV